MLVSPGVERAAISHVHPRRSGISDRRPSRHRGAAQLFWSLSSRMNSSTYSGMPPARSRIASCTSAEAPPRPEVSDQPRGFRRAQGPQVDPGRSPVRMPSGCPLGQFRPGRATSSSGTPLGVVGKVFEEVQQRRIGPVQVLKHEHRRIVLGEQLEKRLPRRELLLQDRLRGRHPASGRSRARIHGASGASSGMIASIFGGAYLGGSVSKIPASALTISPSAQNVIPSPNGSSGPGASGPARQTVTNERARRPAAPCPRPAPRPRPPAAPPIPHPF